MVLSILIIALWGLVGVYFFYNVWYIPRNTIVECNVAIAGSLSKAAEAYGEEDSCVDIRPKPIKGLSNSRLIVGSREVNISDFIPFVIEGASMSPMGLRAGSIAMVRRLEGGDKFSLPSSGIVIFRINKDRSIKENRKIRSGFKVREFLIYANLTDANENIASRLSAIALELSHSVQKNKLYKKLNKAREYFGDMQNVTISRTYKDGGINEKSVEIDYSIHSPEELVGIVAYIIPGRATASA